MPALRWYRFAPPALLLGSAQRPHEIDAAACAAAGVTVHRRRSGGGAVLGDETLLLLDLALPRGHRLFLDDITESYRWIGEVWVAALQSLGLDARAASIGEARADTQALDPLLKRICFGGRSPYEAMVGQRKVIGLAQVRRRGGALFQCGVYLRWQPKRTAALIAAPVDDRAALAEGLAARVAGLDELLGRAVDSAEVIESFEAALARLTGMVPADAEWNVAERDTQMADLERYVAITLSSLSMTSQM